VVLAHFYLSLLGSLLLWALLPFALGWIPTVVMSGSMEPGLKAGDLIAAQPVTTEGIRDGDISRGHVLLADNPLEPGTLYTHRVVDILPDGRFVTRGDNNGTPDAEPLRAEAIKGIERLKVPFIGIPVEAVHNGNPGPVVASILVTSAALMVRRDHRRRSKAAGTAPVHVTRAALRVARNRRRRRATRTVSLVVAAAAVTIAMTVGGSTAFFSATTAPPASTWAAAATFSPPAPNVANCGGAVYTASANTTLTCAVGTVSGTTTNYTLTITGTGALVLWTVTADWSAVVKFQSAKAFGPGVTDTGTITQKTGYQIKGAANGCAQAAACNHAYVSSAKAPETFTVQIVRTA
jgi:signal peptidase